MYLCRMNVSQSTQFLFKFALRYSLRAAPAKEVEVGDKAMSRTRSVRLHRKGRDRSEPYYWLHRDCLAANAAPFTEGH